MNCKYCGRVLETSGEFDTCYECQNKYSGWILNHEWGHREHTPIYYQDNQEMLNKLDRIIELLEAIKEE